MINISNLDKFYGNFQVLKNCNTYIEKGSVVVICGPSGSGKSTYIRTLNRLEPHDSGRIIIDGIELNDDVKNLVQLRGYVIGEYKSLLEDPTNPAAVVKQSQVAYVLETVIKSLEDLCGDKVQIQ